MCRGCSEAAVGECSVSFRESEAVRTEYAQTKCKTDRRGACLGKRLFELVRLSESRRRTTVGKR